MTGIFRMTIRNTNSQTIGDSVLAQFWGSVYARIAIATRGVAPTVAHTTSGQTVARRRLQYEPSNGAAAANSQATTIPALTKSPLVPRQRSLLRVPVAG